MSEQQKADPQVETTNMADTDLEDISGGGTGSSSVVQKNGSGYGGARLS